MSGIDRWCGICGHHETTHDDACHEWTYCASSLWQCTCSTFHSLRSLLGDHRIDGRVSCPKPVEDPGTTWRDHYAIKSFARPTRARRTGSRHVGTQRHE
jgi:hypothetical protein